MDANRCQVPDGRVLGPSAIQSPPLQRHCRHASRAYQRWCSTLACVYMLAALSLYSRTHALTHTHTHSLTHSHTHTLSLSLSVSLSLSLSHTLSHFSPQMVEMFESAATTPHPRSRVGTGHFRSSRLSSVRAPAASDTHHRSFRTRSSTDSVNHAPPRKGAVAVALEKLRRSASIRLERPLWPQSSRPLAHDDDVVSPPDLEQRGGGSSSSSGNAIGGGAGSNTP